MGLFDDYFYPDQFQDSGGLPGRLLSMYPELDFSQSSASDNSQDPFGGPGPTVMQAPLQPAASAFAPGASGPFAAPPAPASDASSNAASGNSQTSPSTSANDSQTAPLPPDIGARLSAGFQNWAQTPVGSPFAALANGITGFNSGQQANGASAVSNGSPAPVSGPTPDLGGRLGAAFQSWALTPVGSPFAALANGVNGFNTGQTSIAPTAPTPAQSQAQTSEHNSASAAPQNPQPPLATIAPTMPPRRPPRRWPG